jgi:hypothetical protein
MLEILSEDAESMQHVVDCLLRDSRLGMVNRDAYVEMLKHLATTARVVMKERAQEAGR